MLYNSVYVHDFTIHSVYIVEKFVIFFVKFAIIAWFEVYDIQVTWSTREKKEKIYTRKENTNSISNCKPTISTHAYY